MPNRRDLAWWYWLVTVVPLAAWLFTGAPLALAAALGAASLQLLHFAYLDRTMTAFRVQVRVAYLLLLGAGAWEPLHVFNWIQLAGTTAMLTLGYCPLARLLSLMPWNRRRPLSLAVVIDVIVAPPRAWPPLRAALGAPPTRTRGARSCARR